MINDPRFGRLNNCQTVEGSYVFRYIISMNDENITIGQAENSFEDSSELLVQLWQRMLGRKEF